MTKQYPKILAGLVLLSLVTAASADNNGVRHYLSIGTSLSVGVQPDINGIDRLTDEGYADQLHDIIAPGYRKLKLTRLGCPGETKVTMINGGKCEYEAGSQLAQATRFLHAHKDKVAVVTIDMGVNDILAADCVDVATSEIDINCLYAAFAQLTGNLVTIMTQLTQVAHPDTKFVAVNYYNTFLAFWLQGPAGQELAVQSTALASVLNNNVLGAVYGAFFIPVADVAAAFGSDDFGPSMVPGVPRNVLNICLFTYMCADAPIGPNIHANPDGYGVIAATIASEL